MMSDFETDARHENQLQTIRKKWNGFGKKYQQKVKRMQDEREETYQQKHMALQEKLRTKNLSLQTLQDEQNEIKNKQKTQKLGLENLEEFTIFPKEVVNGKTVITA